MPQWFRDRSRDAKAYPDERWRADCPREHVALLSRYDHHVVWIAGRPALLLTYHWAADPPADEPESAWFDVSFTYAARHPGAPATVQAVVDGLTFQQLTDSGEPPRQ
jgi:hypothetical protein